jgi:xylulokinase
VTATVLGVDSSTQACKVERRDVATGRLLGAGRAPHPAVTPPRSEQHPHAWRDALVAAVRQACPDGGADVVAISAAAQQHGMVVLDAQDTVLRPAKLWNDSESAPQAQELRTMLTAAQWAQACGSVPVASFTITKLAWLAASEPDVFARVASVLLPHDWLTSWLCGRPATDRGDASGTGYWSPLDETWRLDLLQLVDPRPAWSAMLPEVLRPLDPAGTLTADAAAALGLRRDVRVACGTGDNMAAALALALQPGEAAVSVGTSGTVYAVSEHPVADASGAVAGFADASGRYLPLVCTLNAARVTDTVATLLGCDADAFSALALQGAPGAHGVTLLPYFDGERTPELPDATGTLTGLRTTTSRQDLARAAVEGVLCNLLDGLDALHSLGAVTADSPLRLVGGGARSGAYRQILADLAQRRVHVPPGDEHVALGACVQAAACCAQESAADIARRWQLGDCALAVDPSISAPDAQQVRSRYSEAVSPPWSTPPR